MQEMQETGSIPESGRPLGERNGNPTPVFLPGESQGQRSLAGYSPRGCKESDTMGYTQHNPHLCLTEFYFLIKKKEKRGPKEIQVGVFSTLYTNKYITLLR